MIDNDFISLISHDLEKTYVLMDIDGGISMNFKLVNMKQALQCLRKNHGPGSISTTSGLGNGDGMSLRVTLQFNFDANEADYFTLQFFVEDDTNGVIYPSPEFSLDKLSDEPEVEYNFYQPTDKEIDVTFSITTKTKGKTYAHKVTINDIAEGMTGKWVKFILGGQSRILTASDDAHQDGLPLAREKWRLILCEKVKTGKNENIDTWTVENGKNSSLVYNVMDNVFYLEVF